MPLYVVVGEDISILINKLNERFDVMIEISRLKQ